MSGNIKYDKWINDDNSENYKCRAWVNFDGTGTISIRAAGNVSSLTDGGVGVYTVNFTTSFPDTNYCVNGISSNNNNATTTNRSLGIFDGTNTTGEANMLVDSVKLILQASNATNLDQSVVCISVFR